MTRNFTRAVAVLVATLAVPAAVLGASIPASAAGTGVCEIYTNYCLNTASFTPYIPVFESSSNDRTINLVQQTGTYDGYKLYLLQFNGDKSECVAGANDDMNVVIKPCSGSNEVVWALKTGNSGYYFINVAVSKLYFGEMYLTGQNKAGSQYQITCPGCLTGGEQQFNY